MQTLPCYQFLVLRASLTLVSRSQTLAGRRVWPTAHTCIRLVPTPTPTGVGDKCMKCTVAEKCNICHLRWPRSATSDIRHPSSVIRHPSSVIRHPSSVICHPSSVIPVADLGGIQGCARTPLWTLVLLFINYLYYYSRY